MRKILTIIGARPQFIKASVVSRAFSETNNINEIILHTGQHFDANMSEIFFDQLRIPRPNYLLDIHGGTHGQMTGRMLSAIEEVLLTERPDCVVVYGDTNSTLAGALAAAKLHIPVAHIEAGLRSFNMQMPEEINRILTDRVSNILFCPTVSATENLKKEGYPFIAANGLTQHIELVGDVMQDAAILFANKAVRPDDFAVETDFILTTLHRAENTDSPARLKNIIDALNRAHHEIAPVVLPLHPRTRKLIEQQGIELKVHTIDPVGYLEMLWLLNHSSLVLTDSGGVQKEAFFFGKACVTMRDQTEWVELIEVGANTLVGAESQRILHAVADNLNRVVIDEQKLYGGGKAAQRIANIIQNF
ncbi:non-hydrolyzing UDP-N-acetylglucosamine 2-epimerase [Paenalcaligenes sp. Me131]|uniref:non-hydrolyzing UDP-N-acetylglucosamine 2-epimerase n=1 Tax=Paenalcaligenes sp. Me131 TaxID=3392636 RepID=UPI003D2AE82A